MIYQQKESNLKYVHIWQKYRPVLLKMMVQADQGEQKYELSMHEFKDITRARVSGFSFELEFFNGRSLGNLSKSLLVSDLVYVLQHSPRAIELSETAVYFFQMNKDFVLTISLRDKD